jgi:hypothetical protein
MTHCGSRRCILLQSSIGSRGTHRSAKPKLRLEGIVATPQDRPYRWRDHAGAAVFAAGMGVGKLFL